MPEHESAAVARESDLTPARARQAMGGAGPRAATLVGLMGNRAVARMLAQSPQPQSSRRGLDARSELLARTAGSAGALSRKPESHGKCACGGTLLAGGECSKCLARRLAREGLPVAQIQRAIAARQAHTGSESSATAASSLVRETGPEREDAKPAIARVEQRTSEPGPECASTSSTSVCAMMPRLLARLESDSALEGKVAPAVAPYALGMDGRWLQRQLDAGAPLDDGIRREMEQTFNADFSGVRIHVGSGARKVARHLNAEAVTVGSHVIFGEHGYSPNTREGRRLLRHELAHVVQQGEKAEIPSGLIRIADPAERSEREARSFAEGFGSAGPTLSRLAEPQLNRTSLCEIAADSIAWGVNSALVASFGAACAVGSVVTIGGLAIPCTAALVAAAGMGAVSSVMWAAILKDAMCGIPITKHTPQASATATQSLDGASWEQASATAPAATPSLDGAAWEQAPATTPAAAQSSGGAGWALA